jgi:DNA-binding response OmpR family regulator
LSAERIYIVDDEITIAKLLELWVSQRCEYTTEVFPDGKSFLDRFIESLDIVLLDLFRESRNLFTMPMFVT